MTEVLDAARPSVLVIDDHPLVTQGLAYALGDEGFDVEVRADADLEVVLDLVQRHRPVLALVDLQLPGPGYGGLSLISPLAERTSVVVLTGVSDAGVLGACLEAGALAVVTKSQPFEQLLGCIIGVLAGMPVQDETERRVMVDAARARSAEDAKRVALLASLSSREREVLDHLGNGLAAEAIAEADYVSIATVRSQIQGILRKLQVNNQLAAVARAYECGWRPEGCSADA